MSSKLEKNETGAQDDMERPVEPLNTAELPFLITHWLSNFSRTQETAGIDPARKAALQKIRLAASEIASSFSTLGAFGTTSRPCLNGHPNAGKTASTNASFSDLSRRCSVMPPNQLENIMKALVSSGLAADSLAFQQSSSNLVLAANEELVKQKRRPKSGRTLQDAIILDQENASRTVVSIAPSILERPTLIGFPNTNTKIVCSDKHSDATRAVESKYSKLRIQFSQSMRNFLDSRESYNEIFAEILSIKRSRARHQKILDSLDERRRKVDMSSSTDEKSRSAAIDQIDETKRNCDRIKAQLDQRLKEVERKQHTSSQKLRNLENDTMSLNRTCKAYVEGCRDPFYGISSGYGKLKNNNHGVLAMIASRQRGGLQRVGSNPPQQFAAKNKISNTRKEMFINRFSHATTINMHLTYPVYCLRFDRSGRYFITGADDYLAKVFCISEALPPGEGNRLVRQDCGGYMRGAVLVCTLRGHAGVINDIDVSSDNCFLATASEDGDCRVWGLKDGCPVAILRGHVGGANMVSWSVLTPYQLVTTAHDGFARTWDIREAALKRCGETVGKRPEYSIRLSEEQKKSFKQDNDALHTADPENLNVSSNSRETTVLQEEQVPLPPIPDRADPPRAEDGQGRDNSIVPGRFVANNAIDEGVKLLSKLQHGAVNERGPGTRARAPVKVICLARCPNGGHFATGADDGICRVWSEENDLNVLSLDKKNSDDSDQWFGLTGRKGKVKKVCARSSSLQPLLTLTGHLSAITDLQYSHSGDRILTASQKDGVVRLWSWELDPIFSNDQDVKKVVICLTNPSASNKAPSSRSRRRDNSSGKDSKISCDVAVWTHDDSKIVTSQCQLVKQNSSEIQPGSQFLFLWDSRTGHCLLGIADAHTMQCPVIIPHPSDASLFCSAGADGQAKVWDWETCKCISSHQNKMEYGPLEQGERGKSSGYLDGAFYPNGSGLVLTDDSGRVSMFDTFVLDNNISNGSQDDPRVDGRNIQCPAWMKEQYYANDYYDLFYDTNGYCIERGSEKPPHLAPRGVRSTHSGAPFPEKVNDAFSKLRGPFPLPEHEVRWNRGTVRCKAKRVQESSKGFLSFIDQRKTTQGEFNVETTILVKNTGLIMSTQDDSRVAPELQSARGPTTSSRQSRPSNENRRVSSSGRQLSNNYRWSDYNDLLREMPPDEGDLDSDDEDFQLPAQASRPSGHLSDSDAEDEALMEMDVDDPPSPPSRSRRRERGHENASNRPSRRRRRENQNSPRRPSSSRRNRGNGNSPYRSSRHEDEVEIIPSRSSSRINERGRSQYVEEDSDEDLEYLSTNNTPSGPNVEDYSVHFWKLPNNNWIARRWLQRFESNSSYEGAKSYAPQVGDSIVYIPRAHLETIRQFPGLTPPWQSWPPEAVWPVINCRICDIRHRFPFIESYRSRGIGSKCCSVVAILTLEVIGLPELSHDREFSWPKPSFVAPSRSHVFELSVFENSASPEYIFPTCLYIWRLKCLEDAIRDRKKKYGSVRGLEVSSYYRDESRHAAEDMGMVAYDGTIENTSLQDLECHHQSLTGIGYSSIAVNWPGALSPNSILSPWEVNVKNPQYSMRRPHLCESAKICVQRALTKLMRSDSIEEKFILPVDESRYTDYSKRVEVPMDLKFVETRLQADYYATKQSLIADVQAIRNNCIKYNGEKNDMSNAIKVASDEFEKAVITESGQHMDKEGEVVAIDKATGIVTSQASEPKDFPRAQLRSRRSVAASSTASSSDHPGSSLENLPSPAAAVSPRAGRRDVNNTNRATRSNASVAAAHGTNEETDTTWRPTRSHSRPSVLSQDGSIEQYNSRNESRVNVRLSTSSQRRRRSVSQMSDNGMVNRHGERIMQNYEETTSGNQDGSMVSEVEICSTQSSRNSLRINGTDHQVVASSRGTYEEDAVINGVATRARALRSHDHIDVSSPADRGPYVEDNGFRIRSRSLRSAGPHDRSGPVTQEGNGVGDRTRSHDQMQLLSSRGRRTDANSNNRESITRSPHGSASNEENQDVVSSTRIMSLRSQDHTAMDRRGRRPISEEHLGVGTRTRSLRMYNPVDTNSPEEHSSIGEETNDGMITRNRTLRSADVANVARSAGRRSLRMNSDNSCNSNSGAESFADSENESSDEDKYSLEDENSVESEEFVDELQDDDTGSNRKPPSRRQPNLQASRRGTKRKTSYKDHTSPEVEEDITDDVAQRRRSSRNPISKNKAHSPPKSEDSDDCEIVDPSPEKVACARASRRKTSHKRPQYADFSTSDIEDDSDEETGKPASRKSRKTSNARNRTPCKKSKRWNGKMKLEVQRRSKRSKIDKSDETPPTPTRPRRHKARDARDLDWPEIDIKDITDISLQILELMRNHDDDGIFELPVLETFPDMEEEYQQIIDQPMDFRTIEEDRMNAYVSINQLRKDLALVFRNCIAFNGQGSEYGHLASKMLDLMKDAFYEACHGMSVEVE